MELPVMSIFIDMNMHIASPLKHMYAGMQNRSFRLNVLRKDGQEREKWPLWWDS